MKLGKITVISLTAFPLLISLAAVLGGLNYLLRQRSGVARFATIVICLSLLAWVYHGLARTWPDVFSDRIQLRGPKINTRRAICLIVVMALWGVALVCAFDSRLVGGIQLQIWQALIFYSSWYAAFVGAIYLLESLWLKYDLKNTSR